MKIIQRARKTIILWVMAIFLLFIMSVLPYIIFFKHLPFAISPSDFSDFSTYFNGIATPILMAINIIVLIKLTYEVANANEKSIFHGMQHNAYLELTRRLYSLNHIVFSNYNMRIQFDLLGTDIISFCATSKHLFADVEIEDIAQEIVFILKSISECDYIRSSSSVTTDNQYSIFLELCTKFDNKRIIE